MGENSIEAQEYFSSKFGELADLTLIQPMQGTGRIGRIGEEPINCNWKFIQIIDSFHELVVTTESDFPEPLAQPGSQVAYKFLGQTFDGKYRISSNTVIVRQVQESDTIVAASLQELTIESADLRPAVLRCHVLNYDPQEMPCEVKFRGRSIQFRRQDCYDTILETIKGRRLTQAALSYLEITMLETESLSEVREDLEAFCYLLSVASLQPIVPIMFQYFTAEYSMIRTMSRSADHYRLQTGELFRSGTNGLCEFVKQVEGKFNFFMRKGLNKPIHWMVKAWQFDFMEARWMHLIIAFESLLNFFLQNAAGIDERELSLEKNIEQKLSAANTYLRFIPRDYIKGNLRDRVRNPLVHTGEVGTFSPKELHDFYLGYMDLLVRIFLQMLGYNGTYSSPSSYFLPKHPITGPFELLDK